MKAIATASMVVLCLAGLSLAQEGEKKKAPAQNGQAGGAVLQVRFVDLDANKDGKISKAELESFFARYDTDQDGGISVPEFNAAAANSPAGAGAGRGGEGGRKRGEGEK